MATALCCFVDAFATSDGNDASRETADNVFLGEQDLAEQMEIWRNQYRRMTPGDAPLVQDIGTWPAAWEEFSHAWNVAPANRDLATWLIPVTAERSGVMTILRDANGTTLWSGITDFAKEESASVTLTGALVAEEDWPLWSASHREIERRLQGTGIPRLRDGEGGGNGGSDNGHKMFVSAHADFTTNPPGFRVSLQWTNAIIMEVFAFGPYHVAETNSVTYTNDENQVITTNFVSWHSAEPGLTGRYDNLWNHVGTVSLTNGEEVVFVDTNYVPERSVVRFYAAFASGDADNDGLNDAFETTILGTSTNSTDSDNDGLDEWTEYYVHRTNPNDADTDHDGIDDPTELQSQTEPTKWDTDGDGIGDALDPTPNVSNWWWIVKTSTNLYYRHYIDDLTSWPTNATHASNWEWTFSTTSPCPGAIVKDVTITGFVDDAIKVDDHEVEAAWQCGTTNLDHVSITNQIDDLQSGQFDLSLWDWPEEGFSGPNEVRIGWTNTEPFVAEWTWWIPMSFRLEHVNTNGAPLVVNPSGTATNREFTCQVTVLPTNIPDSSVCWSCTDAGMSFVGGVTNGRSVQMKATEIVDVWATTVEVLDSTLPPVVLSGTVLEKKTVMVYLHIVRDDNGNNAALSAEQFQSWLNEANQIWTQAAVEFQMASNVVYIDRTDWLAISSSNGWSEYKDLQSFSTNTGGLEVYCVNQIDGCSGLSYNDNAPEDGTTLGNNATGLTLAHELGHAFGLDDIYLFWPHDNPTVEIPLAPVESDDALADWCYELEDGGYGGMLKTALLLRLLMLGDTWPNAADIPIGQIRGINDTGHFDLVPVGLLDMGDRQPHHW